MKLGYGTYGMQNLDVFDALPRLRDIGYEAIEINAGDGWPTAPHKLDRAAREKLAHILRDLGFPPPVLMALLPICTRGDARAGILGKFDAACELARDLNFGDDPAVLVSTPGGTTGTWDEEKGWLCDCLADLADRAARDNVILAAEPHAGQILDTPEKSAWLVQQVGHDHLKLNFDISHFHVAGIDMRRSVDLCVPHTVSTHIKDGRMEDGKVRYLLPGEGDLDLVAYMKAVSAAGMRVPVTVEITAQIWRLPDYDPWAAAEISYRALDRARQEAGCK